MSDFFGNFMIGAVSLFFIATFVFFMIGKSGMSSDIFNRTIYSVDVAGLDYIYLTLYEDGNVNKIVDSEYVIDQDETGVVIKYGFKRTFLPSDSSISTIPTSFIVLYDNCDNNGCTKEKVSFDLDTMPMREYYHNFEIQRKIYSECSSNITLGAVLNSPDYEETVLDNNFYNITVPFCFYKPMDISIDNICHPYLCGTYSCDDSCRSESINSLVLVEVSNKYYDIEYTPYLYYQKNGRWYPLPLFNYTVIGDDGSVNKPYLSSTIVNEMDTQYLLFDIKGYSGFPIKVELRLKGDEHWDFENEYEYDKNNNMILGFKDRMAVLFNGSTGGDYTVYNEGGESQAKVFTKIYSSSGEVVDQKLVGLTYNYDGISKYRPYDFRPVYILNGDTLYGGVNSCYAVDVNGIYCFCPIINVATTYSCNSGEYVVFGEKKDGPCQYNEESCSCSSKERTSYFMCMNELEPNQISSGYFYKTVINDENLDNNEMVIWQ